MSDGVKVEGTGLAAALGTTEAVAGDLLTVMGNTADMTAVGVDFVALASDFERCWGDELLASSGTVSAFFERLDGIREGFELLDSGLEVEVDVQTEVP